jgi:hypothetical protein
MREAADASTASTASTTSTVGTTDAYFPGRVMRFSKAVHARKFV